MLFFRKKNVEKENVDDTELKTEEITPKEQPRQGSNSKDNADIDMLKAKLVAQEEYRKTLIERINRQSEEIGELRGLLLTSQRDVEKLKIDIEKTVGMVQEVKPEGLLSEIKHVDAKTETAKSKIDMINDVNIKFREEMAEIRNSIKSLRNIQEIIKMGEEIKADIVTFKKIEASVSTESSKVESMFVILQKALNDIQRSKMLLESVQETQKKADKQLINVTQKINTMADKNEFIELKETVNKYTVYMDKGIDQSKELNEKAENVIENLEHRQKQIDAMQEKLNDKMSKSDLRRIEEVGQQIWELNDKIKNVVDKEAIAGLKESIIKEVEAIIPKPEPEKKKDNSATLLNKKYVSLYEKMRKLESSQNKENVQIKKKILVLEKNLKAKKI